MAKVRFAVGIQRFLPNIAYHHILLVIIAASWITSALLLAGCTTSTGAMNNIYLFSIRYGKPANPSGSTSSLFGQAATGGKVTVRCGYFGLCAETNRAGDWVCGSGSGLGLGTILGGRKNDPLNAIGIAARVKNDVVFPGLVIGGMALTALAFIGLSTLPGWHSETDPRTGSDIDIKPFPSRPVTQVCIFALAMGSLFLLASALWQHVAAASAAATISSTTQEYLVCHVGPAAMALVWISFTLIVVALLGLIVMYISFLTLDTLMD